MSIIVYQTCFKGKGKKKKKPSTKRSVCAFTRKFKNNYQISLRMNYSINIYQNDAISDVCENFQLRAISQDNGILKCEVHFSNNRKMIFFFPFFSFGEDLYFIGPFFFNRLINSNIWASIN